MEELAWHYSINGKSFGPFDEDDLIAKFLSGQLGDEAYVWNARMEYWRPAGEIPVFSPALQEGKRRNPSASVLAVSHLEVPQTETPTAGAEQATESPAPAEGPVPADVSQVPAETPAPVDVSQPSAQAPEPVPAPAPTEALQPSDEVQRRTETPSFAAPQTPSLDKPTGGGQSAQSMWSAQTTATRLKALRERLLGKGSEVRQQPKPSPSTSALDSLARGQATTIPRPAPSKIEEPATRKDLPSLPKPFTFEGAPTVVIGQPPLTKEESLPEVESWLEVPDTASIVAPPESAAEMEPTEAASEAQLAGELLQADVAISSAFDAVTADDGSAELDQTTDSEVPSSGRENPFSETAKTKQVSFDPVLLEQLAEGLFVAQEVAEPQEEKEPITEESSAETPALEETENGDSETVTRSPVDEGESGPVFVAAPPRIDAADIMFPELNSEVARVDLAPPSSMHLSGEQIADEALDAAMDFLDSADFAVAEEQLDEELEALRRHEHGDDEELVFDGCKPAAGTVPVSFGENAKTTESVARRLSQTSQNLAAQLKQMRKKGLGKRLLSVGGIAAILAGIVVLVAQLVTSNQNNGPNNVANQPSTESSADGEQQPHVSAADIAGSVQSAQTLVNQALLQSEVQEREVTAEALASLRENLVALVVPTNGDSPFGDTPEQVDDVATSSRDEDEDEEDDERDERVEAVEEEPAPVTNGNNLMSLVSNGRTIEVNPQPTFIEEEEPAGHSSSIDASYFAEDWGRLSNAVQHCYQRHRGSQNSGSLRLELEITVSPGGDVVVQMDGDVLSSSFESCLRMRYTQWQFRSFEGEPVTLRRTYNLVAGSDF